jgi:hypothetical protein
MLIFSVCILNPFLSHFHLNPYTNCLQNRFNIPGSLCFVVYTGCPVTLCQYFKVFFFPPETTSGQKCHTNLDPTLNGYRDVGT